MDRFWNKVDKSDDCWLWTGAVNSAGYGVIRYKDKVEVAHRVSYLLEHGGFPVKGMHCEHLCGNRLCVKPSHLKESTPSENCLRKNEHGRMRYPVKKGSTNPNAKLTEAQIKEIRQKSTGAWGEQTKLSKEYKVSIVLIGKILKNKPVWNLFKGDMKWLRSQTSINSL